MQRRANSPFEKKALAILIAVSLGLVSLLYHPVRSALTRLLYAGATPVYSFGASIANASSSFLANFKNKESLYYENAMLRAENERMQAEVLDRNLLQERVMKLEEVLGRPHNDNRVVADVTISFGRSVYDTLSIDAGMDHGIQNGDVVVYAGGAAIGEIAEVGASSAKVRLFSSPGQEYAALIGSHSIPAIAHGKGDGNFESKVPQGSAIAVGDRVVIPKGNLILGTVQAIDEKPGVPLTTVFFRLPFNPTEIRTVEVVIGSR